MGGGDAGQAKGESFWVTSWFLSLPVAALSLYVKHSLLKQQGERILARQLGHSGNELTQSEYLSLFLNDLIVALAVLPIALVILTAPLPVSAARWVRLFVVTALCLVMFAQLQAFTLLGSYVSSLSFFSALQFSLADSSQLSTYVSARDLLKLGAVLSLIGLADLSSKKVSGITQRTARALPLYSAATPALVLFALMTHPSSVLSQSALVTCIRAMCGTEEESSERLASLSDAALQNMFRNLTNTEPSSRSEHYRGSERGSDVLFFVMETTPDAICHLPDDLTELPTLKMLAEHSFIGLHHYSTFPYTNRAITSIYSGWYPSPSRRTILQRDPSTLLPGIPRLLMSSGYASRSYAPSAEGFEDDATLHHSLGFEALIDPQIAAAQGLSSWQLRVQRDRATLELLKSDIRQYVRANQRYVMNFQPQIGHAPWPNTADGDRLSAGRSLVRIQDQWLGEIVEELRSLGRLEHTIIVIVGDHGLRTREEYPQLHGGRIEDISFHVPLLIYAPNAAHALTPITSRTSHIDLKPTVLDLLGIDRDQSAEQGLPIWDSGLLQRTVFLFADYYFGADGYVQASSAAMRSSITGDVLTGGPDLNFVDANLVGGNSQEARTVTANLTVMKSLIAAWFERFR